jgi:hypothetical protein
MWSSVNLARYFRKFQCQLEDRKSPTRKSSKKLFRARVVVVLTGPLILSKLSRRSTLRASRARTRLRGEISLLSRKMQGDFGKMQRGANCSRAKSGHFSTSCMASPYSRSRETVIALAETFRGSECRIAKHKIKKCGNSCRCQRRRQIVPDGGLRVYRSG